MKAGGMRFELLDFFGEAPAQKRYRLCIYDGKNERVYLERFGTAKAARNNARQIAELLNLKLPPLPRKLRRVHA